MRVLAALLLVCLGSVATEPRAASAEGGVVEGTYVRVQGKVPAHWLDTAAELGDALFEQLKSDFGHAPEKSELPLQLTIYPTAAALAEAVGPAAIKREEKARGARLGGWTTWDPCRSMVALQRDAFDTRRLVLHELVHQFVGRLQPASMRGREPIWYREGIAEWYGWHRRTKSGIEFGAFDVVASNDAFTRIRALVFTPSWSAWPVASGQESATYESATALVAALRGTDDADLRSTFAAFERDVLARGAATRSFTKLFQAHRKRIDEAILAWWGSHKPRWMVEGAGWDERDGWIEAWPKHASMATRPHRVRHWQRLRTELRLLDAKSSRGGLLLHRFSPSMERRDLVIELMGGQLQIARGAGVARRIDAGSPSKVLPPIKTMDVGTSDTYVLEVSALEPHLQVVVVRADKKRFELQLTYPELGLRRDVVVQRYPALLARDGPVAFLTLDVDPKPRAPGQK